MRMRENSLLEEKNILKYFTFDAKNKVNWLYFIKENNITLSRDGIDNSVLSYKNSLLIHGEKDENLLSFQNTLLIPILF